MSKITQKSNLQEEIKSTNNTFINLFVGIGLGLSLGLIIGLSISPVVQIILGIFSSILGVFLGLNDGKSEEGSNIKNSYQISIEKKHLQRISGFGIALAIGILLGIYIRTTEFLQIPVKKRVEIWQNAGYTKNDALKIVLFERLAIKPDSFQISEPSFTQKKNSGILFAANDDFSYCNLVDISAYKNDNELVNDIISIYKKIPNKFLNELANKVEQSNLSITNKALFLKSLHSLLCE